MKKWTHAVAPFFFIALFCGTWEVFRAAGLLSKVLTPSVYKIFSGIIELLKDSRFLVDVWFTARRTLLGLLLSLGIGVPIGTAMGISPILGRGLSSIIDFLRALPAVAIFPALATLFGIGELTKVLLIAIPSSLLLATFSYSTCRNAPISLIEAFKLRGFSDYQIVKTILIPSVLINLSLGVRYTLPLGLALAVVADMFVGTQHGIGLRLIAYQETFQLPQLYATIFISGLLGVLLYIIVNIIIKLQNKRSFNENLNRTT